MIPIIILAIENDDDREFMTALYMQYHSLMYKLIFDIVKSPWDTEDILQEVLVKLIDKIPTLKSLERQNRINYVAVACKNTAYNFFRDKKPEIMLGDDIDQFGDDCPALDEYFFKEEDLMRLAAVWPLLWGDRIFEKCGIGRDEGGDGGKTLEIRGKRRLSARDGGANYQQS